MSTIFHCRRCKRRATEIFFGPNYFFRLVGLSFSVCFAQEHVTDFSVFIRACEKNLLINSLTDRLRDRHGYWVQQRWQIGHFYWRSRLTAGPIEYGVEYTQISSWISSDSRVAQQAIVI